MYINPVKFPNYTQIVQWNRQVRTNLSDDVLTCGHHLKVVFGIPLTVETFFVCRRDELELFYQNVMYMLFP